MKTTWEDLLMARQGFSRRRFLKTTSGLAVCAAFVPRTAWGANERLNVGCIGIGGKGASDVVGAADAGGTIVALCDVDEQRRNKKVMEQMATAKFYRDFREMLEKEDQHLDAVTVSTPDHTHTHAAVMAMRMGKHVYCQKPLSHSIWEARLMQETAKKAAVATQMGNQAHAGVPIRRAVELIRAGMLGKVDQVHAWTNRPIWPQGMEGKPDAEPVPEGLAWDLWLGPAPEQPYSSRYVPIQWRGWWDFGTGALGDMGCHILDMPFWALELKHPQTVQAEQQGNTAVSGPRWSTVTYTFEPGTHHNQLTYVWYDGVSKQGGNMPPPQLFEDTGVLPEQAVRQFDLLMIGQKGKLLFTRDNANWVTSPHSLLEEYADTPETLPRVENEDIEWITACKGGPPALSDFSYSGPLTELVLLGNVAIRTGQELQWDGNTMKATNRPEADPYIRRPYRPGWEL